MGENQRRSQSEPAAIVVQVVGMLVVADQYRVHRPKGIGAHRGTGELRQVGVHAGWIEGRVHHDPAAGDVDDGRRPAQHADRAVAALNIHSRIHVLNGRTERRSGVDLGSRQQPEWPRERMMS